jgi:FtsH-binding integral membrane protein
MMTKNIGLFILLVFSVANFFIDNTDYRLICSFLGFAGACIAFYGVFKSKLIAAQE